MLFRLLAALILPAVIASPASGLEKSLPLSLKIGAGETKRVRLQKLMATSTLTLRARADCEIVLELQLEGAKQPLVKTGMPREWDTEVYIAEPGDHLLALHNPTSSPCALSGRFGTSLDTESLVAQQNNQPDLQKISSELEKVFIIDDIKYLLVQCDTANSFAEQSTVILCREHMEKLRDHAENNDEARNLVLFTLMHETSHVLLTQWDYPFNSNEDVVDEFTVVLLQLMQKSSAVADQADYFEKQPALPEYRHKLDNDDRHTLSIQRARNLRNWVGDGGLLKRWTSFLIPHFQTEALKSLQPRSSGELAEKIAAELNNRA